MRVIKEKAIRTAVLGLPALCLAAYALGLPLPVPRFLLPSRSIALAERGSADEALAEAATGAFTGTTAIEGAQPLPAYAYALARAAYRKTGMPVILNGGEAAADSPVMGWSCDYDPGSASEALTLLLAPWAAEAGELRVSVDGAEAFRAPGSSLGPERVLELALPAGAGGGQPFRVELEVELDSGRLGRSTFFVASADPAEPKILFVTRRPEQRSVLEALYPLRKLPPEELGGVDIRAYELAVLDGIPLSSLGARAEAALAEAVERGLVSVMAVADSPEFGREGDAPALERVLPTELAPRELKDLPDLAMLILLDSSGSMFGDKLSLAKLSGIETLGNLKPGDLVGMLLFSEEARWVYRFSKAADTDPAADLAPLAAGGGTRLYPALREGLYELSSADMPTRHAIVISDGMSEPGDFAGLAALARERGITISAMAVGEEYDRELLSLLSAGTGGRLYRVLDVNEIPSLILEDRKSVARTAFAEERARILATGGAQAGWVGGMARLSAKPDAAVSFASEPGDPLLASRELAGRSALSFASDLYGRWSAGFFEDEFALGTFRAIVGGLLRGGRQALTVTETADALYLSARGEGLVAPRVTVSTEEGILLERPMERAAPGFWTVGLALAPGRAYSVALGDQGALAAKLPVYRNGGLGARTDASMAAERDYRVPPFALLGRGEPWLFLFFALSLCASVYLRWTR